MNNTNPKRSAERQQARGTVAARADYLPDWQVVTAGRGGSGSEELEDGHEDAERGDAGAESPLQGVQLRPYGCKLASQLSSQERNLVAHFHDVSLGSNPFFTLPQCRRQSLGMHPSLVLGDMPGTEPFRITERVEGHGPHAASLSPPTTPRN